MGPFGVGERWHGVHEPGSRERSHNGARIQDAYVQGSRAAGRQAFRHCEETGRMFLWIRRAVVACRSSDSELMCILIR